MIRFNRLAIAVAGLALGAPFAFLTPASAAPARSAPGIVRACAAVGSLALADTRITLARAIQSPLPYAVPGSTAGFGKHGPVRVSRPFCRVAGVIDGTIRFEVWLPLHGWNGRFEGLGLGAFLGAEPYAPMAAALARGYAVGGTDSGHESSFADASWAVHAGRLDRRAVANWLYRSIHQMTLRALAVVRAVYGMPAHYTYFVGCSTGGGQALAEAQRYPDDYDGIVAGAPANYWTHLMAAQLWYGLATRVDPATNLQSPVNKLALIHRAVLKACGDATDPDVDDPLACRFDPGVLACRGSSTRNCLTPPQVQALRRIYGEVPGSDGRPIFPGLAPGSELGWPLMSAVQVSFAQTFYRYLVFQNPHWNYAGMNRHGDAAAALDRVVVHADRRIGALVNSINPNLRPFRDHGGKLLQYQGWADPLISPYNSVNYYRSVLASFGGAGHPAAAAREVGKFYRLFMVPGMGHCSGGGTDTFNMLGALQQWVERGKAPQRIEAAKIADGRTVRTRPLCPFPRVARYRGHGDPNRAENFSCRLPR